MPLILTTILSFALAGIMDEDEVNIHTNIVYIEESTWEQEKSVIHEFLQEHGMENAGDIFEKDDPAITLVNSILSNEAMKQYVTLEKKDHDQLEKIREEEDYDAIVYIPKGFHLDYIKNVYFNEQEAPQVQIYLNQSNTIRASLARSILEQWQRDYTQSLALLKVGLNPAEVVSKSKSVEEVIQPLKEGERNVPASVYYTIGMLVMFALYVPSFLAGFSFREVYWKVYNRMLLGNVSPVVYAFSIFVAGICVSLVQQLLLLGYGWLVLGVEWIDWRAMFLVVLLFSLFVGSLSAFLSISQLRSKKEGIANIFTGVIVSLFAFLGGSFLDISSFSESLASIGSLTPNGSAMKMILVIQKSQEFSEIYPYASSLGIWVLLILLLSVFIFPKKGMAI